MKSKTPQFLLAIFLFTISQAIVAQEIIPDHGFFINDWKERSISVPESELMKNTNSGCIDYSITVNYNEKLNRISSNIEGINATTYTGNYLDDSTLLVHLKELKPSIIRFPGGDASNMYFFDRIPADIPKEAFTYNGSWTDFTSGKEDVNWKMNTGKYYALLNEIGAKGFITVNYPYARYGTSDDPVATAASYAADWVRYDNGRTKYWEIGNETYACWEGGFRIDTLENNDGQPEYINGKIYGQHFRVFADSMRAAAREINSEIFIGAVFSDSDDIWDGSGRDITRNWNHLLAPELRKNDGSNFADFISVHSYFLDKNEQTPTEIVNSYKLSEELQKYIFQKLDNAHVDRVPLALTEWNIKEPHQTSQIGGIQAVAAMCKMQEIGFGASLYFSIKDYWREENGDFGLFSNNDPELPNSEPYPAFYHFYYMDRVLGDEMVQAEVLPSDDSLICFASSYQYGGTGMIIINTSASAQTLDININNFPMRDRYYWYELSIPINDDLWSQKVEINGISNPRNTKGGPSSSYTSIPAYSKSTKKGMELSINKYSAIYLLIGSAD